MLQVLKLFLASRNATINEVHFPAELGPSFVYTTPEAVNEAVNMFLGIEASSGPRGSLEDGKRKATARRRPTCAKKAKPVKPHIDKPKPPGSDGLVPAREAGEVEAEAAARKLGSGFPVFYPSRLPSGAYYVESNSYEHIQDPRVYHLKDSDDERHAAYRMVGVLELARRHPLLRDPGDPGLVGSADPQQPEPDQDHSRARIRHLRRWRSGQDDRLAPRRQQLLGFQ